MKHTTDIAFLGGARWQETDQTYIDAYNVAKILAQEGFRVINGGGPGVMEAATRGAHDGGQKFVVAVTYEITEGHKNYEGKDTRNNYDEEIITTDYFDRTKVMLENADIHIVFNGSTGTLSEFGMTWASSRIHEGHHKPIILYGNHWVPIIKALYENMLISKEELALLKHCNTPEEVLAYVIEIDNKRNI
ncbi:MAG: LOG family protein [Patescibacteria group bacterium]|uniref:LOG family protein n=1 Tax=candidate division WWE3 bacterium TaxID=2053526 RepID=A0A955J260_UNCKA|nr:LOG family protein [candidate division WWE3 bacterium]